MSLEAVHRSIDDHRERALQVLARLVRQPSISAQNVGVRECARLLVSILEEFRIPARIIETPTQPVVYGELVRDPSVYTLLCYGHYDVQPPDPLDQWESDPFDPVVRDGRIYGRGTADNKGQLLAHVLAAGAWAEVAGRPPVNVKFVFEGEEESGSPSLADFVARNRDLLEADLVYISDGGVHPSGAPVISLGNRGILGLTLVAEGAARDTHSGNKGGVVPNPVWMLIHVLATMVDPTGRVLIDGFYDAVRPVGPAEEEILRSLPFDPESFGATSGVERLDMDGPTYWRRIMLEPYVNINGVLSGYVGPGSKTIIPARAECRIDIRLVVDQRTEDVWEKVRRHVARVDPRVQVLRQGFGRMEATRTPPDHPAVQVVSDAVAAVRGVRPYTYLSMGGSLPNAVWPDILGADHITVPYANADENNHAPNENLSVERFHEGVHISAQVFHAVAEASSRGALPLSRGRARRRDAR
jgi:acetylornithine deacetylase/succinyl-diaminopimelate desuccinylase-like protein